MKITIVAFDLWGFNKKIADYLTENNHDVTFFDSNQIKYTYKNKLDRVSNFINKTFFNKNIKKTYLNETLINKINVLTKQDTILIVNPSRFNTEILSLLRSKTNNFIAYNYDSLDRMPLPKNYQSLFNKIFSFDIADVKKHDYLYLLTNYIYLKKEIKENTENKAFMILSKSKEREILLSKIADIFDKLNLKYEFIVANPVTKKVNKNIKLIENHISLNVVYEKMKNADILIDLVRPNQTGLSFRIFEAMALHKKIITNNETIKQYDFYNENNILVINEDNLNIPLNFINSKYQPLPENIYNKYTIETWVDTVFNTKNIK